MFGVLQILVSPRNRRLLATGALVLVAGCGQKGPLFVPTGQEAAGRATLPETLNPTNPNPSGTAIVPSVAASSLPPSNTASPVRGR